MPVSKSLSWISAFFLTIALFYAPLAYGCTRPEMLPTLYGLLGGAIVSGLLSFILRGELPKIQKTVLVCCAVVLTQGWIVTLNPRILDVLAVYGWAITASMETILKLSFDSMLMTTMLLLTFVIACGLFADSAIRRFVMLSLAASGVLIAVTGVVMKLTGDPLMLLVWKPLEIDWNDFAFYRYHGNAGAFLNLAWPLILTFTRRAWTGGRISIRARVFWTAASLVCGSALVLNASKAALAIGLMILPWPFFTGLKRLQHKRLFALAAIVLLVFASLILHSSQIVREASYQRMTNSEEVSASLNGRVVAYHAFVSAIPTVGAWGFGPGLFQVAFPYQYSPLGNTAVGLREYAHEDYLQTSLEWGWFGTFFWAVLVIGGVYVAFRTYAKRERFPSKTDRHLLLAVIVGVLGLLAHSSIDFPLQIASIRLPFLILLAFCWASPRLLAPAQRQMRHYRLPVPSEYEKKRMAETASE